MSEEVLQNDSGAAFPMHERDDVLRGMSLSDYFAAAAISESPIPNPIPWWSNSPTIVEHAMLKERRKP